MPLSRTVSGPQCLRVIVACEFSGVVRDVFIARGHDAVSCDLLPSERPGPHIQMDIFKALARFPRWDLMLAFWPCTRLCNSGVRWLDERNLWREMKQSALGFRRLLEWKKIPRRCLENPIPHKYAIAEIGAKYDQIIQPWQYGHGESKATCLWLRNLRLLRPTRIVDGRTPRVHHETPSPDRWKRRSRTYDGIAEAMASQWGLEGCGV